MDTDTAILVIDDDPDVALAARYALAGEAARIDCAGSLEGLEARIGEGALDAVLLDMNFVAGSRDGAAGLDGLARIAAADPALSVVLMTAYGGVALAVEALKRGAADFVLKPWKNDRLTEAVASAARRTRDARAAGSPRLDDVERGAIARALARSDGNISKAAAALGVTRPALYRKIEKHGL